MNDVVAYPKKWQEKELSEVSTLITDGAHFSPVPQEFGELIVNVKDLSDNGIKYEGCTRVLRKDFEFLVRQNCSPQAGDILLSKDGTIGKVILFESDTQVVLLSSIAIIRLMKGVWPDFVKHVLRSFIFDKQLYSLQSGSALKRIVLADIKQLKIPLPKLNQQKQIANILSTVDNLIEKTQTLIDKYTVIKQGMMADIFTRGIDLSNGSDGSPASNPNYGKIRPCVENSPELYKKTELGWVPKDWCIERIGVLAKVKGGKRLPAGTPFACEKTPYPYLRVTDMVGGWINDSDLEYVTRDVESLITKYKIFKNDIYVTIAGTLGKFGRIPEHLDGAQLTENAARITSVDFQQNNIDYLSHFLQSDALRPQLYKAMGLGAGVPKLALYQIEQLVLLLPTKCEQDEIVKKISLISSEINSEQKILAKYQDIKKGLMQDLLTGKVKVN